MAVDLSIFDRIKTPSDYVRMEEEFNARKRARQQQQQLGQLQIRKYEQDLNAPEDFNAIAERGIFDFYQGKPLDDRTRAAIQARAAMEGSKTSYTPDEFGNVRAVTNPNPYEQFLSGIDNGQYKPARVSRSVIDPLLAHREAAAQQRREIEEGDLTPLTLADIEAQLANTPAGQQTTMPQQRTDFSNIMSGQNVGGVSMANVPKLQGEGMYAGSPKQQVQVGEANVKLAEDSARLPIKRIEKNIDVEGNLQQFMMQKDYENAIAQANAEMATEQGKAKVNSILERMNQINNELKVRGAIVSSDQTISQRLGAAAMTTDTGMGARKVTDPDAQALAEEYTKLQSLLLPYYAASAGLGAKSIDSDGERRALLDSFGSPQGIYEANSRQLGNISTVFGGEISKPIGRVIDFNDLPE